MKFDAAFVVVTAEGPPGELGRLLGRVVVPGGTVRLYVESAGRHGARRREVFGEPLAPTDPWAVELAARMPRQAVQVVGEPAADEGDQVAVFVEPRSVGVVEWALDAGLPALVLRRGFTGCRELGLVGTRIRRVRPAAALVARRGSAAKVHLLAL